MNDLQQARLKLNDIDAQMAFLFERKMERLQGFLPSEEIELQLEALFQQRMRIIRQVAEYKKRHQLPIYDPVREAELIERNCRLIKNKDYIEAYKRFIQDLLAKSKRYQEALISGQCLDE